MRTTTKLLLVMTVGLLGLACEAKAPKGILIYCSYSCTGMAGLGKDYCELIADPGTDPMVRVVLNQDNRFGDPEIRAEYPATVQDVATLMLWLQDNKVYELDGYDLDERMTGGHAYRIYMEYDSGDKVNARWYGHDVKAKALTAYNYIENFFTPWRERAKRDSEPISECYIESTHMGTRAVNACRLLCQPGYRPTVIVDLNMNNRLDDQEYHGQFDIDEESVETLQKDLIAIGAGTLGDYKNDELIEGGTRYRVELVYPSGRKQSMMWHATRVDDKARAVYDCIDNFFGPWKAKAMEED